MTAVQKKPVSQITEISKVSYQLGVARAANYIRKEALKVEYALIRNALFTLADEVNKLTETEQ